MEISAKLVKKQAISTRTNEPYTYVSVQTTDGLEVGRLFLRALELQVLFPNL